MNKMPRFGRSRRLGADRPHVVVAGAGPGGLASAMMLAAAGAEVTVLERRDRVGGRSSAVVQDGFTFDLGPTFFLYPQILAEIFAACGRRLEDEVELIRLDPMYRLVFEGGVTFEATPDLARLQAEVAKHSPEDAAQRAGRYHRREPRKVRGVPPDPAAPVLRLAVDAEGRHPARTAAVPPVADRGPGPEALVQAPARAARLLVPVQIPGHVARSNARACSPSSPYRVRARRVSPDGRLRRAYPAMARVARAAGGRDPADRADRGAACSTAAAPSASGRRGASAMRRRGRGERRLRPRDARTSCPTGCAAAGPMRGSRRSGSPARPSCFISASRGGSITCTTTRSS